MDEQTINETIDFLDEVKPDSFSAAGGIILMPGTAYYSAAKQDGYIEDKFWLSVKDYKVDYYHNSKFKIFIFTKAIKSRKKIKDIKREYNFINYCEFLGKEALHFLGLGKLSEYISKKIYGAH